MTLRTNPARPPGRHARAGRPTGVLGGVRAPVPVLGAFVLLAALVLSACGPAPDPLAPPEIVYGEDVCDACGMIISEERFAAATIVGGDDGPEPRRFDDIGDMIEHHRRNADLEVLRWYVHDYDSLEWMDATTAAYVRADRLSTPMGHGLAAFGDSARAEAFAAEMEGEVLSFESLSGEGTLTGH